jgi:polar amino acid transport system permease protein
MNYELRFDMVLSGAYGQALLYGIRTTLILFALSWCAGVLIGLLLAGLRTLPVKGVRMAVTAFVEYQRDVPVLVHLLVWYFGIAAVLPPILANVLNRSGAEFACAFIALSLYSGAYMSEDFRAGLRAIPDGQYEAARSLGLRPFGILGLVILPQAFRLALPPLVSQTLSLYKNTSVAAAIGVADLMYRAREIQTETFRVFETFSIATLFYFVGSVLIIRGGYALQRRLMPFKQAAA